MTKTKNQDRNLEIWGGEGNDVFYNFDKDEEDWYVKIMDFYNNGNADKISLYSNGGDYLFEVKQDFSDIVIETKKDCTVLCDYYKDTVKIPLGTKYQNENGDVRELDEGVVETNLNWAKSSDPEKQKNSFIQMR